MSAITSAAPNLTAGSVTVTTKVNGTTCSTDSACSTALSTAAGESATVTATYPCNLTIMGVNFASGCTLSATTADIIEMKRSFAHFLDRLRGFRRDQRAVSAVMIALLTPVLIGLTGFVIDIGHVAVVQRQLQAATDAAALAGGYNIPSSTAVSTANSYSTTNAPSGVTTTMVTGYPVLKCLTSTGVTCTGTELSGGANAIQVSEQATVPLWFAQILGFNSFNLTATSTAGARGGTGEALNVMIVLDTTASMQSSTDNSCGLGSSSNREQCAVAGVETLLTNLNPTLDYVGIMAFPGLQSSSEASQDFTCGQSIGSGGTQTYSNSPVYQVVGLSNNFKSSSTATTLNTSSDLALAVGDGGTGCSSGVSAPGGQATYYAGAITAAQAALTALSSTQTPPAQNVIVFLSDGGANSTKTAISFSGWIGTCTSSCHASTKLNVTSCSGLLDVHDAHRSRGRWRSAT